MCLMFAVLPPFVGKDCAFLGRCFLKLHKHVLGGDMLRAPLPSTTTPLRQEDMVQVSGSAGTF